VERLDEAPRAIVERVVSDLDSLVETLELLGDQTAIKELVDAEAAVGSDDVVRGVDAVRALRSWSSR